MTPTKQVIQKVISEEFDRRMPYVKILISETIKEEVPPLIKEQIAFLPTKDDFYTEMDKLMGEIKAMREEFTVNSYNNTNMVQRIKKVEKKLFGKIAFA